jgi:hypothetical protein
MFSTIAAVAFSPLLPWPLIAALGAIAAGLVALGLWRGAAGIGWRAAALAAGLAALANPSLVEEQREPLNDVAALVVDLSPSQDLGGRRAAAEAAEAALRERLAQLPDLELRVVRVGADTGEAAAPSDDGTRLFEALQRALGDVPRERVAGAIMITDGQVHDAPAQADALHLGGPLHVLLTGSPDERDRRLIVERAPSFGMVGDELALTVRVEEAGAPPGAQATVTLKPHGGEARAVRLPIGESRTLPFRLEHGGATIIELEAAAGQDELTLQNNRAAIVVNGVRDRLRVLLVSGEPHAGERVWRNLLKADPSVDLVHFTILRPPEKQDGTPIRELSLIAFPIRELFEIKLAEFDLIIFDRYRRRGILPSHYFENIANYVKDGGALLEASGPAFATPLSLYRTALSEVLPGRPTGATHLAGFTPMLTDKGRRHPVTADLPGAAGEVPGWGRWLRMVDVEQTGGVSLLSGHSNQPVLLLDRVGKGRVAQLLSDHAWLWARGFEGGGPQGELLRRLAHWLMKEPDLEEDALRAEARGSRLEITRRSLETDERPVTVTAPDGGERRVEMKDAGDGRASGTLPLRQPGLYRLSDGERTTVAVAGTLNPKEFADVRATAALLAPAAEASGGAVRWLAQGGVPELRRVAAGRDSHGRGWIGLTAHKDYVVTGVRQIPLLPVLAVLLVLLGGLLLAWRREGR